MTETESTEPQDGSAEEEKKEEKKVETDFLDRMTRNKRSQLIYRQSVKPLAELQEEARAAGPPRGFAARLTEAVDKSGAGLIAEIKKASPSQGLIVDEFDVATLAQAYKEGGAACLSVVTEGPHFQGKLEHVSEARDAVDLPLLRKDVILDPYQVVEARAAGADCVLVILAAVDKYKAQEIIFEADQLDLDVLVEVHNEDEMAGAKKLGAKFIGINNRNLQNLEVDLAATEKLAPLAPEGAVLVAESGLDSPEHLARMHAVGVHRFLVGTSLLTQEDVAAATRALLAPADTA